MPPKELPWLQKLSYGVGHVLNDLCASMWFTYLLLYFESVNLFSKPYAGYVLLLGQVTDAISTPLVGYESDRINGCFGYGKRKSFHALGSSCVAVSFPFIFMRCIGCVDTPELAQFFYYAPFIIIFQFGWSSTQISHLALIPELASSDECRVELNAIRYAFTVLANIAVYGITWLVLSKADIIPVETIVPADHVKFREIVFIVIGVGLVFTSIFHFGTHENPSVGHLNDTQTEGHSAHYGSIDETCNPGCSKYEGNVLHKTMTWRQWLREYQFYLIALMYMCTRLIVNLLQIYLPMFVLHTLNLHKKYTAVVPLVVYASGLLASFIMKPINREAGRKITYILGLLLVLGGCSWMWFMPVKHVKQMFGAALFLGFGTSTILVTSLAMTADMIGGNVESGAFVYGAMSFTDKLSNGVAVVLIQYFHPVCSDAITFCMANTLYYRRTIAFVPGSIACVAFVILLVLVPVNIGQLRQGGSHSVRNSSKRWSLTGSDTERNEREPLIGANELATDQSSSARAESPCLFLNSQD